MRDTLLYEMDQLLRKGTAQNRISSKTLTLEYGGSMLLGKLLGIGKERNGEGSPSLKSPDRNSPTASAVPESPVTIAKPNPEGLRAFEEGQSREDIMEEILEAHDEWVRTGGGQGKRADLRGMDLTGYARGGANLAGANLAGAILDHAKLYGAQLQGADLRKTSLQLADLRGSNLNQADLSEANLMMADLGDTSLVDADLRGADARGTRFNGADLSGVRTEGVRRSFLNY